MFQLNEVATAKGITAEMWNALLREVMRLGRIHADAPLRLQNDQGGVSFSIDSESILTGDLADVTLNYTNVTITYTGGGTLIIDGGSLGIVPTYKSWTGNQDDVALDDEDAWIIVTPVSPDPLTVTGFAGGYDGRMLRLTNEGPSNLKLTFNDGASTSTNRIYTPNAGDWIVTPYESIDLQYEGDQQGVERWRIIDRTPVSAPATPVFSGARVTPTASQTVSHEDFSPTALTWNAEEFDTDTYHDNATNNERLTAPFDGYYQVGCRIEWNDTDADGDRDVRIETNGAVQVARDIIRATTAGNSTSQQVTSGPILLAAGDYVRVKLFQDSGSTLTIAGGEFWIAFLGT